MVEGPRSTGVDLGAKVQEAEVKGEEVKGRSSGLRPRGQRSWGRGWGPTSRVWLGDNLGGSVLGFGNWCEGVKIDI